MVHGDADLAAEGGGCATVLVLLAGVAVAVAVVVPNLVPARKNTNRKNAIGALKTIGAAQQLFRESDRESDGNLDYGTLAELGAAGRVGLIDSVLASGTKNGYLFECTYGSSTSEFLWFAVANPAIPGVTERLSFCANQDGVIFYTLDAPFELNADDCAIPARAVPWGK